ncbi:hypothetical protein EYM_02715 [Ignicoccus islandicus DSM 13165]|uniref:Uncharacterized protein n=1 Tax=Ignicoccus islandicus DSM 13165 TaxID=940295 RepID=A0A0U3EAK4_9CREN|nr:hypothetical protein EYM_02715 [Ignicoccus islandicus DSM 13165]
MHAYIGQLLEFKFWKGRCECGKVNEGKGLKGEKEVV